MTRSTAPSLATASADALDRAAAARERTRGRTTGALVMTGFGAWWATSGLARSACPATGWALLAAIVTALAAVAIHALRTQPAADGPLPASVAERRRRASRIFWWTCVAEVLGIFVGVNVVANLGHAAWQPVAVMAVVGLHFLPLAVAFGYRPHLVTGVALTAWAAAYPLLFAAGAAAPAGLLAAGAILLASAAWALRAGRQPV